MAAAKRKLKKRNPSDADLFVMVRLVDGRVLATEAWDDPTTGFVGLTWEVTNPSQSNSDKQVEWANKVGEWVLGQTNADPNKLPPVEGLRGLEGVGFPPNPYEHAVIRTKTSVSLQLRKKIVRGKVRRRQK